jgi:hypothetical protein
MRLRQSLGLERRHALTLVLVVLVALAGCAGLGGDGSDVTPTSTAGDTPTAASGDDSETDSVDASASEIVGPAVEAIESVSSYTLDATLETTVASANTEQTITSTLNTSVDREASRLASAQTSRGITTETYLVDGVVYQRSPQLVQQYNSEWIKIDVPNETSAQFNRNDELAAHRVMLEHSAVDVVGAETVDGERAYRLAMDVNTTALNDFYGFENSSQGIESANTSVWISRDSNRLLKATGTLQQTITVQGQATETSVAYNESFAYTDVSVSLPEAASSAVEVNGTTGSTV